MKNWTNLITKTLWCAGMAVLIFINSCTKKSSETSKENTIVYDDYLKSTSWRIGGDRLIGLEEVDKEYLLQRQNKNSSPWNFTAIIFDETGKFKTYSSWECGNDCFISITGVYAFIAKNKIRLSNNRIERSGVCEAPTEYYKDKLNSEFEILRKSNDSVFLVRIK